MIIFQVVGYIYKRKIYIDILTGFEIMSVESVSFSDATAHFDAVDGMAQAFFGYRYKEIYWRTGIAVTVHTPYCPQRICNGSGNLIFTMRSSPTAE